MANIGFATRAGVVAGASAATVLPLFLLPARQATAAAAVLHAIALAAALLLQIRAARAADAAMRRPRWCLVAALLASAAGALMSVAYIAIAGSIPIPSLVDPVTMAWVPLAAYGFWLMPTRPGAREGVQRLLADGAVAASALFFASWLLILKPLLASHRYSGLGTATQLTYPVIDVFVSAMVLSLLPRVRADLHRFVSCVAAGFLLITLSDTGSSLLLVQRGESRFGWPDVTVQAGMALLAYGALVPARPVWRLRATGSAVERYLQHAPIAVVVAVVLWHIKTVGPVTFADSAIGSILVLFIILRQIVYVKALGTTAEAYHHAAVHDLLTGLANRKAFFARLEEHVSTPGSGTGAVLLLDLDGFKEVNDTLGHSTGDEVLTAYAKRLSRAAPGRLVARLGGDEFAIFLVDVAAESAAVALAAVITAPDAGPGPAAPSALPAMASSIGIALLRPGDAPIDILRRADLAMYSAKRSPTTRFAVFHDDMAAQADRRHLLVAALPGATERGEMRLVYQPLYRLGDGILAGAEVLLRWTHPLLGVVPPAEFIPLAEETGYIGPIGSWVLAHSVAQMAAWQQQNRFLPRLFINVSVAQFTEQLPAEVAAVLDTHGLGPDRLTLEITEGQLPGLEVNRPMQVLRGTGVQIALDDFGAGYSSLAQLARLPVDVLKIDRDFVSNLGEKAGRPVLDAVINLAKALGLTTVAEGIEDLGQAAEVSNAGVDIAQGYLFARPLSPDEMAPRLPLLSALPAGPEIGDDAPTGVDAVAATPAPRLPPRRPREARRRERPLRLSE